MLGWFKKKFSKKKKQEAPLTQESVPEQENVVAREDGEPFDGSPVDDATVETLEQEITEPVEKEKHPGEESGEDQQEAPLTQESVSEEENVVTREDGEPFDGPAVDEATVETLGQEITEPVEKEKHPGEESCCVTEEQEKSQQTFIAGSDETVVSEPVDGEISVEDTSSEQPAVSAEEEPEEALPLKESLSRGESLLQEDEVPEEETLEETLSELIGEAENDAASLEELTKEADLGIVDQTLEELLASDQPDDDDFRVRDVVSEEETSTGEAEDTGPGESRLPEMESPPEGAAETEEKLEKIVDQPLEELLADEQPDEVSDSEDYLADVSDQETGQPELEKEPSPDEKSVVSSVTADKPTRKSLFQRLQERLGKTRQGLLYRLDSIFLGKKEIDEDLLDELEEILITSDLGVATTMDLLDAARRQVKRKELSDPQALKKILRDKILGYLLASDQPAELVMPESGPFVIMVVGVNGVGKTTTIGKIANKFKESGQSVLLIAADTFRAAAIDQLKIWAQRVGTEIIAHKPGADPSSVVFDGLDYGVTNDFDAIIIDTAGRLHTSVNLMEELKKIRRVIAKKMPGAPHEVLLVLDATTGQNGISQAKLFGEAVGVSGLALTKLDGTAKGGIVANVCRELKIPVRFIGIGEQMDDLRDFDAHEFVDALFAEESGTTDYSAAA